MPRVNNSEIWHRKLSVVENKLTGISGVAGPETNISVTPSVASVESSVGSRVGEGVSATSSCGSGRLEAE